jgi:protein-tyrosine-phosphatase
MTKVKTKIHFVCRGNVYRSILAEGYLKSKNIKNIEVSSSGINVLERKDEIVYPWAKMIAKKHNFYKYMSKKPTQTTSALLNKQNIVVFLNRDVYGEAKKRYKIDKSKTKVWNVNDNNSWGEPIIPIFLRWRTFRKISNKVNELYSNLLAKD